MACLYRMLWSFSRDGGIPFHRLWSAINRTSGTPILAVWAMVTFAFLLGLPMLHSTAAFQAVTSISTIGLYISCERSLLPSKSCESMKCVLSLGKQQPCMGAVMLRDLTVVPLHTVAFRGLSATDCTRNDVWQPAQLPIVRQSGTQSSSCCADGIPILMRLINGKCFEPGPFNLGRYGPFIGSVAVMWVIFITVSAGSPDARALKHCGKPAHAQHHQNVHCSVPVINRKRLAAVSHPCRVYLMPSDDGYPHLRQPWHRTDSSS